MSIMRSVSSLLCTPRTICAALCRRNNVAVDVAPGDNATACSTVRLSATVIAFVSRRVAPIARLAVARAPSFYRGRYRCFQPYVQLEYRESRCFLPRYRAVLVCNCRMYTYIQYTHHLPGAGFCKTVSHKRANTSRGRDTDLGSSRGSSRQKVPGSFGLCPDDFFQHRRRRRRDAAGELLHSPRLERCP